MQHGLLVTTQDPPDGARVAERWQELLALAEVAERSGFTSFHLPEHHSREDGYLPQPLVACAAVAARTSTIQVGTALTVAPLRHPLHLAEEAAVVDVLSNGRLVLAVGIGNFQPEFEMFDLDIAEQGSRFDESLRTLTRGLAGDPVDERGTIVRPRTVQRPRPDIWVGAMSLRGARRAAEFGLPLLCDPLSTIEELEELVAHYRRLAAAAGHEPRVILMRWGWVGNALEAWWPHVRPALWSYLVEIPRVGRTALGAGVAVADDLDMGTVAIDRLLVGGADEVRALAEEWTRRLGAERLVVKLQGTSGPWGAELRDTVEAYGRDVIAPIRAKGTA
jgi:alkanesulfonate monooxygenase SsuD/methylene tetrahydromethanopterin reductase-like flavin-dependent oxidoreductase (luciferase family)